MGSDTPELEIEALEEFIQEYLELGRGVQQPKGIYSILQGPRERKYQYTLKYFLNPQNPHGFGHAVLETFLTCIGVREYNLAGQHIEIDDEVQTADDNSDRRIDLIICGGSALADHPDWAVFVELKVGADEGRQQTTAYATAETWNFDWFGSNEISTDRLNDRTYVYVKRRAAEKPADHTGTFDPISWAEIVTQFETDLQGELFEYPTRSVIQVTDFMNSLRETEGMDTSFDTDELNERLNLYFEYRELIQQVEKANSQFEHDFEDLSAYLVDSWVPELSNTYDFEASGWETVPHGNAKYQKIRPEYWGQDPLNQSSTIELFYRHAPTTDHLRNQRLVFRLRLPPARDVHTESPRGGQSFNELFAEKCTSVYAERIEDAVEVINPDDVRLGSASALVQKEYQLDAGDLAGSYFNQLSIAVREFCTAESGLTDIMNEAFEDTYRDVFGEAPAGEYGGNLLKNE